MSTFWLSYANEEKFIKTLAFYLLTFKKTWLHSQHTMFIHDQYYQIKGRHMRTFNFKNAVQVTILLTSVFNNTVQFNTSSEVMSACYWCGAHSF